MLRLFAALLLTLILVEALLALALWAGFVWLGGATGGLLLALALAILLVLPWVGEMTVAYDSQTQEVQARFSWWATARLRLTAPPELRLRLFGLPFGRTLGKKAPPAGAAASPPAPDLPAVLRFALAAFQAAYTIASDTRQLALTVNAPTEIAALDQVIAGAVGRRTAGPMTAQVLPDGERRVRLQYRTSVRSMAVAGLFLALVGRPRDLRGPGPTSSQGR